MEIKTDVQMDLKDAAAMLGALAQETRLAAFRLLVEAGATGLPAGAISSALEIPQNTLSFHLTHLSGAGLVTSQRRGRQIIYSANFNGMQTLVAFLVRDCCRNDAGDCGVADFLDLCPPSSGPEKTQP